MEYVLLFAASLSTAGLTLYSGFGLGTLLLPVFTLFFAPEVAVMATALVHFANNIFKLSLVGRQAQWQVVGYFGIPAVVAAFAGAAALSYMAHFSPLCTYIVGGHTAVVTPLKLAMAVFMFFFALVELLPFFKAWKFDRKYLVWGGLLSGFFGGFSGHQGALRSAFLAKVSMDPAAFVGTNAVIAFLVDMARLSVYGTGLWLMGLGALGDASFATSVVVGIVGAMVGVLLGKKFLHKLTMRKVQLLTGGMLLVIALALGMGIL